MRFSRWWIGPALRLGILLALVCPFGRAGGAIDAEHYLDHVRYLASEQMRGRGTGTPELEAAAEYIAEQFQAIGVKPVPGARYFQRFPVTMNAEVGPENRLAYSVDGEPGKRLRLRRHFVPLSFSGRGKASGQLVFAGYGISANEYGYDDYAGVNAKGKIVVILRHEPQEFDRDSAFAGTVYTEHSQLFSKADNAKLHGARAVLMVNDTSQHGGGTGELTEFSPYPGPASLGIPFLHVDAEVVAGWFAQAGRNFQTVQNEMNAGLEPRSFEFPRGLRVRLRADVRARRREVRNVAAFLPGRTRQYIIIGAHYDHIGLGEQFSMLPSAAGTVHPGADDNASGTAGLIELARHFAARRTGRRGILFVAFAGEELGLLGSGYYVRHPLQPLSRAVAMINMDMIGRIRDDRVYVGGATTGAGLRERLEALAAGTGLRIDLSETMGYGSSDHTAFTTREIPVLFFFSGLHRDYHRPSDTWDKIKAEKAVQLLDYVAAVVNELSEADHRPRFLRVGGIRH